MRSLLFYAVLSSLEYVYAQEVETSTIILPPSTVMVATTITSYSPDITVTVTPTFPASPQYTSQVDMIDAVLNSTNYFRWEHNASFLAWNASLTAYAASYAEECLWAHSHGPPGENLARGYPTIVGAVDAWGNERDLYNFHSPTGFTESTGHFTQLIWKSTQTVGCAAVDCAGKNGVEGWFLVCEYWPPGNVVGQGSQVNAWFEANVQSPVNSGQGFNIASATAGASGVGTSWASLPTAPTAPTTTRSGNTAAVRAKAIDWELEIAGGFVVLLGVFGL